MAIKFLSGLNLSNVTAGSILKLDSNGNIVAAVDGTDYNTGSDAWSDVGSDIYRNSDVRIGTYQSGVAPAARLHVFDYQTTDPKLLIEDGNTGDASMQFKISTQQYTMGIDNSDSDKFVLAASSALGTTNALEISTTGVAQFGNDIKLSNGWTLTTASTSYAKFGSWVNIEGTGFYTYSSLYMDLDDSSSRFVIRSEGNTEEFIGDTATDTFSIPNWSFEANDITQTSSGDNWSSTTSVEYNQTGIKLSRSGSGYVSAAPYKLIGSFTASVSFKTSNCTHLGIIFAASETNQDDDNYGVILRNNGSNGTEVRVQKRSNGGQSYPVGATNVTTDCDDGNWHELTVSYNGKHIVVDVDGTNYINHAWTDTTFTSPGLVGLAIYDNTCQFNDFQVTETPSTTTFENLNLANGNRTLDVKLATSPSSGDVGVQFRAGSGDYLGLAAGGGTGVGLVVDSNNNVGIGTINPSQTLEVAGTIQATSAGTATLILRGDSGNSGDTGQLDSTIKMLHDDGNHGILLETRNYAGANTFEIKSLVSSTETSRFLIDQDGTLKIPAYGAGFLTTDANGDVSVDTTSYVDITGDTMTGDLTIKRGHGDLTFLTLKQENTSGDLVEQKSFIDFTFVDSNTNETPQVRIGAEVGNNDGSASSLAEEGMGAFVVYTNNADTDAGAAGTSLAERFRVDRQGYVGIRTSSPNALLQIDTPAANQAGQGLRLNRPLEGTNYHSVEFATNGTVDWSVGQNSNDAFEVYENGAAATTRFTIKEGGKVGIGTTSPSRFLTVSESGAANGSQNITAQFGNVTVGATSSAIYIGAYTGTDWLIGKNIYGTSSHYNFEIGNQASGSSPAISINNSNNVGIGTTSPGGKLHLEGDFESGKALVIKGTYGTDTEYYFRTHGTNSEYLALYAAGTRIMNFNSGIVDTYKGLRLFGGAISTGTSNHLVIGSSVQIGQGDEDPVIEFKYGTTSLGKIDQFGDIHAGGFKVSGTTGFLKSDGTVDTTTYANGNDYLALAGGTMTGDLTIPAKIIHSGDTNTYFLFGTDTITLTAGGSSGISVESGIVKSLQDFVVTGGETFALGERAEGDDNGRTVLIEGTANGSSGEGSGRIFFTEHNSTDASADKYGLSLYYEGDPNAALPSGFQPNTGNATWSLRRHNNSINGAAIMSGSRDNSNVTFGGNLYVPNVIYHTGDTNTYMQFHAADQWRVVTGGSERLEVNNTYTTVANDFWAEDKSHAGNQNWKTKTYIRAVGVEGGSIADKWVHLTTVDIDAAYDKAALKFKIHGYDDVSCGTENIDVLYENGGSVQETHRLDWYSTDGTANLFKAVKSTHSGSNLAHSYELWVQMAGDWRDTFTVEVETWTDEAGFITYSEAVGQVTAPSGDTNDQSKTSREWYTKNTTIYADGTALQTQSQADNRYLQLTGGTVSGAVTLGAQLTLSSFGTGVLRVDAGSVSVDTSNYLTSMPANSTVTSVTFGGVKVEEASDRPGLLEINRDGTDTWSGIMTKFSGTAEWALMGNETSFGLYDDQQNEWAWRYVENSYFEAYNDGSVKLQTASNGVKILNVLELGNLGDTNGGVLKLNGTTANKQAVIKCTNGNLHIDSEDGNALYLNYYEGTSDNIIFGNGNGGASGAKVTSSGVVHATSVEVAGNLSVRNITARDIVSAADRTYSLGTDANRWAVVFCETLDSAGQHESKLQNPEGETPISEYETGTVLVWKGGKNVPCTKAADHMRMGIAVKGIESPLVQGAEPVLCTGEVKEGDYLVTSTTEGHAEAISPEFMRQHMLFDCVIGKALEDGAGESHLVKTWINI